MGRRVSKHAYKTRKFVPDQPWVLTRLEIREKVLKLIEQGWGKMNLGRLFGWHEQPNQTLKNKIITGIHWSFTPIERIRVSRVLHMIEGGYLKQEKVRGNGGIRNTAVYTPDPPPPKAVRRLRITASGPVLVQEMDRRWTPEQLYARKNP